ncbi:hypothetical protein [Clostridium beijerinckii]|uniref:hypothetical protein n=1 Tax=Clostridium beijerinckii TaxID=1520 RepID=UPI0017F26875|nr:hypothetical protein [Clostridium beijerinckii]NYC37682.1 hypothetical protein [Clostridium beijerinckii]
MNIKRKLTLTLLLASSVPLIIFTIINLFFSQKIAIENALADNFKRAQIVDEKINGLIERNMYGIKSMARNPISSYDAEKSKQILVESSKVYPDLSFTAVTKLDGVQFVRSDDSKSSDVSDRNFYNQHLKERMRLYLKSL